MQSVEIEESLRSEVFNLWIRDVVNAANGLPPVIEQELETRIPRFPARVREELESAHSPNSPPDRSTRWNWLKADQAKRLLAVVDRGSLRGKRDYAMIAMPVGCRLRAVPIAETESQTVALAPAPTASNSALTHPYAAINDLEKRSKWTNRI
jgi:hypothetical protein